MVSRVFLLSLLSLASCDPVDEPELRDDVFEDRQPEPGELELIVSVMGANGLNPHGDGSGRLRLRATAEDAERYTFSLDGADPQASEDGELELVVEQEGVNDYVVEATAFLPGGDTLTASQDVTVYRSEDPFPTLMWADEFDVDGRPDLDLWHHQVIPPEPGGWFNGEQQHYVDRAQNSYVSDGTLKIVARKESYETQGIRLDYTSARMNSKYAFQYGRVEVRARLPRQGGTWPAIWTLGANIDETGNYFGDEYGSVGWPACGEIDILEQTGWDKASTIAHFHWGNTQSGAYENEGGDIRNPDATSEFHVYSLDWTEESMRIYVDDALVHELENTEERPFDNPHYLLLNIAMGGNLGGSIPGSFDEATMEIDYVRVYQ